MKRRPYDLVDARSSIAQSANRALASSGRSGTWNRARCASTLASAALPLALNLLTAGCNFTDFSKTKPLVTSDAGPAPEPACVMPTELDQLPTPIAHWTFNGTADGGQWNDEQGAFPLVPAADAPASAPAALAAQPRINGQGQSLSLGGHQFVRSVNAAPKELVPKQFTIAAWISVPARSFTSDWTRFAWPILSTLGDNEHCDGYQLEVRFDGAPDQRPAPDPELVLSYQTRQDGDGDGGAPDCQVLSLVAPLQVPSWATGTGRWHHVAGSLAEFDNGRVQLALYWDGKQIRLQNPLESLSEATSALETSDRVFFVGTSALNAASAAQTKFTGFIDDIAIFDRALTPQELHEFVLASTTQPGPSNCRWRASEQWDTTAFNASFTTLLSSNADAVSVQIDDWDWGAGAVDARIEPPRDIQLYDTAYLDAYVPEGQGFQFTLANGDNYCTWTYRGRGQDRYGIDLTHPVSCVSTSCEVDLHRVDRASLTSEWAIPNAAMGERKEGLETFTVQRLEFSPARGALPDWTGYGGARGPLGDCWRLQAYEPETAAVWNQGSSRWRDSLTAILKGESNSGTRMVADFGEDPLDISNCKSISFEAKLELPSSSVSSYAFVVQDVYGSWRSYDLSQDPNAKVYTVADLDKSSASSDHSSQTETTSNFALFPDKLDFHKVRLIGIQKPWGFQGARQVTLSSLQFFDHAGGTPGCERAGRN